MGKGFEIFEHTSEIGFRSFGKDLEEAFENAGRAAFYIMVEGKDIEENREISFQIESEDLKSLLYDYLDELIYRRDLENMVFASFHVEITDKASGFHLKCTAKGRDIGRMTGNDVKAVTYSEMKVEETKEGVTLQVVLDV